MIIMISVIGGRIIPSFTRNWMVKQKIAGDLPTQPQSLDLLVIASTALALLFWLAFPDDRLTGLMLILAARGASASAVALGRPSHGARSVGAGPSSWLPLGADRPRSCSACRLPAWIFRESAGVHALTAGAMTTMILAVMTRASLGHTARELKAAPMTVAAYVCVTIGALLRVAASIGLGPYPIMLDIAGVFWALALLLFLIVYRPILWGPAF